MTKFDMVTHVRNKHISGVSRPHPKGAGLERPQNFWDKHVCTKWFGLGRRNLGWQHMWGGGVFLGVIHAPHCKEAGLQRPPHNFCELLYLRAHSMRHNNQILYDNQTRSEENFVHGRPRMLTRDLFAVEEEYLFRQ